MVEQDFQLGAGGREGAVGAGAPDQGLGGVWRGRRTGFEPMPFLDGPGAADIPDLQGIQIDLGGGLGPENAGDFRFAGGREGFADPGPALANGQPGGLGTGGEGAAEQGRAEERPGAGARMAGRIHRWRVA